jgi:hypothetical protein
VLWLGYIGNASSSIQAETHRCARRFRLAHEKEAAGVCRRFGQTTLAELRKKLGSNGFGYKARGSSAETPDGIVMMNSYEAGAVVVTFYTKINREEFIRLKASGAHPSPADCAELNAMMGDNRKARPATN